MHKNKEDRIKYDKVYYQNNRRRKLTARQKYYEEHKDQHRETSRRYYQKFRAEIIEKQKDRKRIPKYKFFSLKSSAKRRGLVLGITLEEFGRLVGKPCIYCGKENTTMGIDRINNQEGYLKENIASCCFTCNSMKLDATLEEFLDHVRTIYKFNKL